jgi:GYF domain 2
MGMGMGANMAQNMGPWSGSQPAAAPPPPPPPVGKVWHLAADGATTGPFAESDLVRAAAEGRLTRATMVWTAGQDGWKMAADTDLARLLDSVPPPPPKA